MNERFLLWLLLPLLLPLQMTTAQESQQPASSPPPKQSHYNLRDELDLTKAQQMMAQRLHELHELHRLQHQVQEMLNDPRSRDDLRKLSESNLPQMLEKMLKDKGLSQHPKFAQFLKQAAAGKELDPQQREFLHNLAAQAEHRLRSSKQTTPNSTGPAATPPILDPFPSFPPPLPLLPSQAEPGPSLLDRLQEKTKKWLMEELADVSDDMLQALAEMGGNERNNPLAELLRSVRQSDLLRSHAEFGNERVASLVPTLRSGMLSHYLSNVGDFLHRQNGAWDKVSSLFHEASPPSMPHISGPSVSMHISSPVDGDSWAPALLSLLMLGAIVLLLCKSGFSSKVPSGRGEGAKWRLGSWPVSPAAVSTQQDVIRTFEYLALLRLGPAAAACHHRRLAERLAELPPHPSRNGGDEGKIARRQAAKMLAQLYEQARYAPAGEALSPEQLSEARHVLCFFAGVIAV